MHTSDFHISALFSMLSGCAQVLHMLSVAQRAMHGEFASLGELRAAMREQARQIKLALSREAVQLAGKECALGLAAANREFATSMLPGHHRGSLGGRYLPTIPFRQPAISPILDSLILTAVPRCDGGKCWGRVRTGTFCFVREAHTKHVAALTATATAEDKVDSWCGRLLIA